MIEELFEKLNVAVKSKFAIAVSIDGYDTLGCFEESQVVDQYNVESTLRSVSILTQDYTPDTVVEGVSVVVIPSKGSYVVDAVSNIHGSYVVTLI